MRNDSFYWARVKKEMTQKSCAEAIGRTPAIICGIENGTRKPTREQADTLSKLLGVPVSRLFPEGVSSYVPPLSPKEYEEGAHYWVRLTEGSDWDIGLYKKTWSGYRFFVCSLPRPTKVYEVGDRLDPPQK